MQHGLLHDKKISLKKRIKEIRRFEQYVKNVVPHTPKLKVHGTKDERDILVVRSKYAQVGKKVKITLWAYQDDEPVHGIDLGLCTWKEKEGERHACVYIATKMTKGWTYDVHVQDECNGILSKISRLSNTVQLN
jgi:hypothetical protein